VILSNAALPASKPANVRMGKAPQEAEHRRWRLNKKPLHNLQFRPPDDLPHVGDCQKKILYPVVLP
jgi:hypothetical protein